MTTNIKNFELDQGLKEEYLAYAQSTINDLESALNSLGTEVITSRLGDIQRQIHSLKGTGTSYGFPEITRICRHLEDCIKLQKLDLLENLHDGIKNIREVLRKPN